MTLVFIYGPVAAGKLTVARALAALTGLAVFHNHLIVDAVGSVFPFGTPSFIALRESFWLTVMREAAREDRSLVFTFAPEPTVAEDFPARAKQLVEDAGGTVSFVHLTVAAGEQERRLEEVSRREFDKMRSVELLRSLRGEFDACEARMPEPSLTIDTTEIRPHQAALTIARSLQLPIDPSQTDGGGA